MMDKYTRRISEMPTKLQAACRRAAMSICVVTTFPMAKKSNSVRSGDSGGHRTGVPHPIQWPEYAISSQSCTVG
ncbi:hypothetical protein TNCV_3967281 [Trichonephila clavipes]|nr:hypothetical protein TNCV_3967281 [Trichonephila clavipes]